jgi:hypothetical protein
MENSKVSALSLSSIRAKREKEKQKECKHDYIKGEWMGYDSSSTDDDLYLFTCKKCKHEMVFYEDSYFDNIIREINKENIFRLEFSESRQVFHLDNYTHQENTHGWFTICDVTDKDFKIIKSYLEIFKGEKTKEQMHLFINKLMELIKQK